MHFFYSSHLIWTSLCVDLKSFTTLKTKENICRVLWNAELSQGPNICSLLQPKFRTPIRNFFQSADGHPAMLLRHLLREALNLVCGTETTTQLKPCSQTQFHARCPHCCCSATSESPSNSALSSHWKWPSRKNVSKFPARFLLSGHL